MSADTDAERLWGAYLDAVEAAAGAIARQAVDRRPPAAEDLTSPPLPGLPWPASLERRRREVLAALSVATSTVERCRNDTARTMGSLPSPAARSPQGYLDGGSLDVLG
jgi:hypothetical protein